MGSCVHAPKRTQEDNQGGTALGKPDRVEHLGETQIPYSVFLDYLLSLGETKYKSGTWNLVKHNCNSFTDEVSQFICGSGVPKYILDLPDQILNTADQRSLEERRNATNIKEVKKEKKKKSKDKEHKEGK